MSKEAAQLTKFPGGDVTPRAGELRIAIDKKPYAKIIGHAVIEPDVEVCGVLVGRVGKDAHGEFLHVDAVIRGEAARQEGAQVTFTHDTWNHIHKEMDAKHPDREIVGWYHTHGGFGIFLSDMDAFIHNNFFSAPHQVAYVYDPLAGTEGFFRKAGDKLELGSRYWLGGRERPIVSQFPAAAAAEATAPNDQLTSAVTALQRTAASLHAATISRQPEAIPIWLMALLGGGALFLAYSYFMQGGVQAAEPARALLLVDRQGKQAVGIELREVEHSDGPVYVDASGRKFVGIDGQALGLNLTLFDPRAGARAGQPPGPSSIGPKQPPAALMRHNAAAAPKSRPSTTLLLTAAGALIAVCGAIALFLKKRTAKPKSR